MAENVTDNAAKACDDGDDTMVKDKKEAEKNYKNSKNETTTKKNAEENGEDDAQNSNDNKKSKQTELSKYWKAVKENPNDFTGWTYLLQFVEQQKNIMDARVAFDAFLEIYPYCFGYWRKLAEMERKYGTVPNAEEVYEKGINAIPLSVDLWLHYINFYVVAHDGDSDLSEKRRNLYERAIAAAGTDFRSDKMWDSYITFEESQNELARVTAIYDKLFTIPTQLYSHHMDKFKKHVEEHHPKDILSLDDFFKLRREAFAPNACGADTAATEEGTDVAPPGVDEAPPGSDATVSQIYDESEVPALRAKMISQREDVYSNNEMEVSRRWAFEEAIKRPYFHVKPLERGQLKNWREYLDYEMDNGSHERIVVLFERCMIVCALYDEFWLKYARYMEGHSADGVRSIYSRACGIHLPKKPSLFYAWAAFEERQGKHDAALEVLDKLLTRIPNHAVVTLKKIGVLRRSGDHARVEEMYKTSIDNARSAAAKNFYAGKYARYLSKVLGDVERSRDVLNEAINRDQTNSRLYLQLIDTEFQTCPVSVDRIDAVFHSALAADLPLAMKVQFSQRRLDFLDDFSPLIDKVMEAYNEHQKLTKEHGSERKRKLPDASSETQQTLESTEKKSKDNYEGTAAASAYPPNSHDSAYNSAYGPQAGYNAAYYQQWANYAHAAQQGHYSYPQWHY